MSRLLRPGWILVALLVVILAAYATQQLFARASGRTTGTAAAPAIPAGAVAPAGVRVRVP
jgi:NO-binding membrane sensor protein with MHYT domain